MPRYQVIVWSEDNRVWDCIRDDIRTGLYRVGELMNDSAYAFDAHKAAKKIQSIVLFGGDETGCAEAIKPMGFTLTVKELGNVNIIDGVV